MYPEAIEEYKKAAATNPAHIECHHNAGIVYEKMGKLGEAEKEFEAALKLNPNLAPSLSELGSIHMKLKKYDKAAKDYLKLAELTPGGAGPFFMAARAEMYAGNLEAAIQALRRARAINPIIVERGIASDPLFKNIRPEMLK
jgi:tetratricopeptide (TPR) repeat protein